jgi:copper chaperone CopZ
MWIRQIKAVLTDVTIKQQGPLLNKGPVFRFLNFFYKSKKCIATLNGVSSVKVDLKSAKVDVEYNSQEVSLEKIKETIDDQGYDVK